MGLLDNTTKKATVVNPREMIIFSFPKVGKTSLFAQLPGTSLTLDFEGGTDYFDMEAINVNDLETFGKLTKEFTEKKPHYNFIALDTLTSLYSNIVNALAVDAYNKEENANKPLDYDITLMAYGIGYSYKRAALQKVVKFFKKYCDCLILSGHVADKSISVKGESLTVKDLDIEGKLKNILALKTDAIGLLNRTDENTNTLSFVSSQGSINGSRIEHLSGKDIVISEKKDGVLTTHWDQVFKPWK